MSTEEVLVCETCGKGFTSHMALLGHMGYHKNSGRYKCELCALEDGLEVVFSLPQGLGAHMRAKHDVQSQRKLKAGAKEPRERLAPPLPNDPPGVYQPPLKPKPEKPPVRAELNGSGEIATAIALAFAPLERQYQLLQERQRELAAEQEQTEHDLKELWVVLQGRDLTPPPNQGVQVGFQKMVSDSLSERAEEWLANRRTGFTVADLARGIATSHSTAAKLISIMRDQGKLRLVGKKRQANAYVSTTGGG